MIVLTIFLDLPSMTHPPKSSASTIWNLSLDQRRVWNMSCLPNISFALLGSEEFRSRIWTMEIQKLIFTMEPQEMEKNHGNTSFLSPWNKVHLLHCGHGSKSWRWGRLCAESDQNMIYDAVLQCYPLVKWLFLWPYSWYLITIWLEAEKDMKQYPMGIYGPLRCSLVLVIDSGYYAFISVIIFVTLSGPTLPPSYPPPPYSRPGHIKRGRYIHLLLIIEW